MTPIEEVNYVLRQSIDRNIVFKTDRLRERIFPDMRELLILNDISEDELARFDLFVDELLDICKETIKRSKQ